jgi:hypothetical protein
MRQKRPGRDTEQSKEEVPPITFVRFDASLFKPALLGSEEGLAAALAHFHAVVACRDTSKALHVILSGLCDERHLFEFFYGGALFVPLLSVDFDSQIANETVSGFVNNALLENPPKTLSEYTKSPSAILLTHFHASLRRHALKGVDQRVDLSIQNHQALQLLVDLDVSVLSEFADLNGSESDDGLELGRKKKQGASKQERKIRQRMEVTEKTLAELEDLLDTPIFRDKVEIKKLEVDLLEGQLSLLHVCCLILLSKMI